MSKRAIAGLIIMSALGAAFAIFVLLSDETEVEHDVAHQPAKAYEPKIDNYQSRAPDSASVRRASQPVKRMPQAQLAKPTLMPSVNSPLHKMRVGKPMTVNGRAMDLLAAVAVPKDEYRTNMGAILFEQNGFAIVADRSVRARDLMVNGYRRPVVRNPANGRLGIVSGTLICIFREGYTPEHIAQREGFETLLWNESSRTAYFKAGAGYPLLRGAAALARDPEIESVEIEVLQGVRGAR